MVLRHCESVLCVAVGEAGRKLRVVFRGEGIRGGDYGESRALRAG